jgi:MFS family permease
MTSPNRALAQIPDEELYTLFTRWEKWYIVFLISFAGWFSTLSSFIYYPAITEVAHDLHATVSQINLTVASYMAVSTIAPAFVGDAADVLGRRMLYLIVIAIYLTANIALANTSTFSQLLGLRMLQSGGVAGEAGNEAEFPGLTSTGTFSIAYGVIADISTPAERGSYVSALSVG